MTHDTDGRDRQRRRRRGVALIGVGALLLSGPLVAGAVTAETITASSESSGTSDYVGPDADAYGTIEVTSGTIEQVTSNESGTFGMHFIDGSIHGPVLIQQLEVKGDGEYTVLDPAPGQLAKNLDSFSPTFVEVVNAEGEEPTDDERENGPVYAKWEGEVSDGETDTYRWLGALPEERVPFRLTPTYILDGQTYDDPEDILGESGEVEVRFKWNAIGLRESTVYFLAGDGTPVKQEGPIYLPSVGVFKVPLPANFTNVRPITMDAGGDGFGGTLLAGTLVMMPPLGPDEITVGFKANVEDFYMPSGIVEWVYANVQDNASFATIGTVLGQLGGSLTGAAQGLQSANIGEGLDNLAKITDGVSRIFNGLTDVQGGLQRINRLISDVTRGVAGVNGVLNNVIDNGGPLGECDVTGTLGNLVAIVKGETPDASVNTCSLLDLQTKAKNLMVGGDGEEGTVQFVQRMTKRRLDGISTGVAKDLGELEACPASIATDFRTAPVNTLVNSLAAASKTVVGGALLEAILGADAVESLRDVHDANPKYTPDCGLATLLDVQGGVGEIDASDFPNIVIPIDAKVLGPFAKMLVGLAAPATGETEGVDINAKVPESPATLPPAVVDAACEELFPIPPLANNVTQPICKSTLGSVTIQLDVTVQQDGYTYKDASPLEYLKQTIKGQAGALVLDITIQALRAIAGIQQLTNQVISGISTVGTFVSGANTAIGQISTTVNAVIFQGLSRLLSGLSSGLGNALPALGQSLGGVATTLNYEYAVFNAYAFMATLGGAQPYGPPWTPSDVTEFDVDPATGVVVTPPVTAGAPLDGGETQPAAELDPVPAEPPEPGEGGDPTIQEIDKRGFTAYQVPLVGFGGERSVNAPLYFAAILAILIGGIVGGLIMRARK